MNATPVIYLIAGEPSGDLLGAKLIQALHGRLGSDGVEFAGVGGPEMAAWGLNSLFPMAELSVMGLAEILPHVPHFLRRINQTVAHVKSLRPAILITIDSPGFCFRVARKLRGNGIPLVHYVAPSVWAWRPGRARKVAGFLDHLLALLPFEPPYFETVGLATTFIGHPVVEGGADKGQDRAFRDRHGIDPEAPLLAVLPGSRNSEISRLLPVFAEAVSRLAETHPGLRIVVPTVAPLRDKVMAATRSWAGEVIVVEGAAEKFDAFAAANAALAASGTVALELAMAGTPTVIAYKVHPLTAWVARRLIKTPYVNLINVVLDRPVVPELIQQQCRAELLGSKLSELLTDRDLADRQIADAGIALDELGRGGPSPSDRAADVIISIVNQQQGQIP